MTRSTHSVFATPAPPPSYSAAAERLPPGGPYNLDSAAPAPNPGVVMPPPKNVAAIVTEYRRHSHADVIVGKILEGYLYDDKEKPNLRVVSMYVDQFPEKEMSRELAK